MRGKGKSVQHPQSRTCSRGNTLKRCKNIGEADNVVLIDVDSDTLDNIKVINVPDSLKKKVRGSSVICIDDDESYPSVGEDNGSKFSDDASSSGRVSAAFNHSQNSVDPVGDECQFVQEIFSPFKLSKCKRTYSGKASGKNRYGLDSESDNSGSSDNDFHDCEFMEGSFGKLREDWEKAYMKRKNDLRGGMYARCDEASSTGPQKNVEVENPIDELTEAQVSSRSGTVRCEEESPFPFAQTVEGISGGAFERSKKTPSADFGLKSTHDTQFSYSKGNNREGGEGETNTHNEHGGSILIDEEDQCCQGPSLGSSHEQGNEQVNHSKMFSQHEERTSATKPSNPEPTIDVSFGHTESSFNSHVLNGAEATGSMYGDNEKMVYRQSSFQNIETCHEMRVNHGVSYSDVGAIPEEILCEVPSLGKSGIEKEKGGCQDTMKQVPKEPSLCSISRNEVHTEPIMGSSSSIRFGEISSPQEEEERDVPFHSQDGNVTDAFSSLINEREKLKETDEYKRAVEEEWASRQRELQLQAEEAQKLRQRRKRMNAESMRLLDMERRQKQRVEEMREIQKKDEENMNMKEQLRAEVRKELNILENKCPDMASLLRGLGIQLGGGFKPLPHEVRAAYKRALLSFHPDRASGSDIRQLVEAEEKFKLISRMKDKLLMTY
ncbi:hypothetical protein RHMOL_Rhmol09G0175800 [Rhododendron molle]|uniref:Uncharacterized protein n=1 Tax=Rhododendron molle TaxID=49168 RepID=A0ACC0MFU3_RHOML|nr:hypothetical protein RHMOL_Rhmol09G0175800 [Rhododendron molle]